MPKFYGGVSRRGKRAAPAAPPRRRSSGWWKGERRHGGGPAAARASRRMTPRFPRSTRQGVLSMHQETMRQTVRSAGLASLLLIAAILGGSPTMAAGAREESEKPLRVIVFGAHPDDCELSTGGTAARGAKLGHKVKFVGGPTGDIGHHELGGAILARRRTAEVKKCAEILGIEPGVLDTHDGELMPPLENRRTLTRKI